MSTEGRSEGPCFKDGTHNLHLSDSVRPESFYPRETFIGGTPLLRAFDFRQGGFFP